MIYVYNMISAKKLNSDLEKISKCAFQWKMQFNPDPNKPANEVTSSGKTKKPALIPLLPSITMSLKNILILSIWALY